MDVGVTNTVTLSSENTIKMNSLSGVVPVPVINQIQVHEGSYSREEKTIVDKTELTVLKDVVFPVHFKVIYNTENYEVTIYKPGNWTVLAQISERQKAVILCMTL